MFVALDKNGNRIDVDDANKDERYFCPICGTEVILKTGDINAHHFAHKSLKDCDTFSHDMSEWHRTWQSFFPKENRECIIEHDEIKHRADVCYHGIVIEFQHSPISEDEFWKRNNFYTNAGYKVVWIFDLIEVQKLERIEWYDYWEYKEDHGETYKWKYPWRFLRDFLPQEYRNIHIFISRFDFPENPKHKESDVYIEKVTWVNEYKDNPWSYIRTSNKICNFYELLDWLERRCKLCKEPEQLSDILKKYPHYKLKLYGIKGGRWWQYNCPRRSKGLNPIGPYSCQHCKYCIAIENKKYGEYKIYCNYPTVVNKENDQHSINRGYECESIKIFK